MFVANVSNSSPSADLFAVACLKLGGRRRFRATRKVSGVEVEFRRENGRPGGDVGNRKRHYDNSSDINERLRQEERVVRQQIEDGILEARFGLAGLDNRPGRKGKRNGRRNHHSGPSAVVTVKPDRSATQTTAKAERPAPRFRFKAPVKTVATVTRARPITLTNAELRARLGLPPREAQAA